MRATVATIDESLVDALYRGALHDGDWLPALENMRRILRSADAAFTWVREAGEVVLSVATQRVLTPTAREQYFAHYGSLDPKTPIFARAKPGFVFNDTEHFDTDFVRRDPFYQEYSHPLDSRHTLDSQIANGNAGKVYLAAVRTSRQGAYNTRDIARFRQASSHFRQVLALRRRLTDTQNLQRVTQSALDAFAFGVIVLDAQANVVVANDTAIMTCGVGEGLQLKDRRFSAISPTVDRELSAIVARVLRGGAGHSLRVARDTHTWWLVSVVPTPASSPFAHKEQPGALVLIADPGAGQSIRLITYSSDLVLVSGEMKLASR